MKKLILLLFIPLVFACSNMESDAEKACDLTTQTMEMMPEMLQLGMKAGFGDEESKKEAQKQLDKLEADIKSNLNLNKYQIGNLDTSNTFYVKQLTPTNLLNELNNLYNELGNKIKMYE